MKTLSELLDAARQATGLENLGDDSCLEGAERLVSALASQASLNHVGVQFMEQRLVMHLEQRLRVEEYYRRYPEIENEQIVAPLIGIGLPRTGSTALSFLLACDPAARSLRAHESSRPADSLKVGADGQAGLVSSRVPGAAHFVPDGDNPPAECQELMALNFRSQLFLAFAQIPDYAQWLLHTDLVSTYAYEKRVLKLLQWGTGQVRWRLKAPTHVLYLDALNSVFPDARFVMTHRDPVDVMPSVCALYANYIGRLTDSMDPNYVGALNFEQWSIGVDRAMAFRADGHADRCYDIDFRAMQRDPIGAIRGLYAWLDEPLNSDFEQGMRQWWAQNANERAAVQYPEASYFGLDLERVRERFSRYTAAMTDWVKR